MGPESIVDMACAAVTRTIAAAVEEGRRRGCRRGGNRHELRPKVTDWRERNRVDGPHEPDCDEDPLWGRLGETRMTVT